MSPNRSPLRPSLPGFRTISPGRLVAKCFLASFAAALAETSGLVRDADTGINILEGFDAELVYSVPESQGSWVAMAFEPKGTLIVSDQDSQGVFRVTLPPADDAGAKVKVESLKGFPCEPIPWGDRTVGGALGFLYAFDSLYMSTMKGFYRIRDTDGDGSYDEFKLLNRLKVGYEHSAHSIIETEDGKGIYLVTGNHTPVPEGVKSLQPPVWATDSLLPEMPDPMGHAVGIDPPGGWICRISPDGNEWTMVASGFRNAVDLAINREGELFTYDSDLEFDIGSPWYRPTRVNHVISGGEYGWRAGSAKWPDYFADSMGSVVGVGPGSPTGISFGYHSDFPPEYQDKLFICDWTFGTMFTVEMTEKGSSYTGTKKEFLNGSPLNISAMRFGPDGNMYFLTGGRNTASKLYRIRYTGSKMEGEVRQLLANQELRDLRHSLEALYTSKKAEAVEMAWPHLAHADRGIRYAARIAIENQQVDLWREKVFAEEDPRGAIHGAIALCRLGDKSLSGRIIAKLSSLPFGMMDRDDRLALLRAYSLCLIRLDAPDASQVSTIIGHLDPHFPADDREVNIELCRVLSHLDAPSVVPKTIARMKVTHAEAMAYDEEMLKRHQYGKAILDAMADTPNSENIQYAYSLRRVRSGWSLEDRKHYFTWLNETLRQSGGKSFAGYIRAIRDDAIAHLPPEDREAISPLLGDIASIDLTSLPVPKGPPGAWTTETAMKLFEEPLKGRDFENGKRMFSAGRCAACHRFEGTGGYSGPDLGSVGRRYSIRDIIVAICEPSDSISEQYQASSVTLKDGGFLYGRVIYRNDKEIAVAPNPYDLGQISKAPMDDVEKVEFSQISVMPPGTVAAMNADELKDLMAYLISGGDRRHASFKAD